jgi:hypothetical protein
MQTEVIIQAIRFCNSLKALMDDDYLNKECRILVLKATIIGYQRRKSNL